MFVTVSALLVCCLGRREACAFLRRACMHASTLVDRTDPESLFGDLRKVNRKEPHLGGNSVSHLPPSLSARPRCFFTSP